MERSDQYTENCQKCAKEIVEKIKYLRDSMIAQGDTARAMDLDEAITYIEGAVGDA